jgi:hypothetical protein
VASGQLPGGGDEGADAGEGGPVCGAEFEDVDGYVGPGGFGLIHSALAFGCAGCRTETTVRAIWLSLLG